MRKKYLFSLVLVFMTAVVAFIGSFAYFTDRLEKDATFTFGSVEIKLYESFLHRTNNGATHAGRFSVADPDMQGVAGSAPESANWTGSYFTDEQIIESAGEYSAYLSQQDIPLVPGDHIMKCPYVYNCGTTPAYIRVRVLIPAALDGPDKFLDDGMYMSDLVDSGVVSLRINTKEVNNIVYNEYAFVYQDVLQPGEMTFWNVWGDIKVSESITLQDALNLIDSGHLTAGDNTFKVLIQIDAIQANNLPSAAYAFETVFDLEANQ